jgi:hypothetical protein
VELASGFRHWQHLEAALSKPVAGWNQGAGGAVHVDEFHRAREDDAWLALVFKA